MPTEPRREVLPHLTPERMKEAAAFGKPIPAVGKPILSHEELHHLIKCPPCLEAYTDLIPEARVE